MSLPQLRTVEPERWPGAQPAPPPSAPPVMRIAPTPIQTPARDRFHAIRFVALIAVMVGAGWAGHRVVESALTPPPTPAIGHVSDAAAVDVLGRAGPTPFELTKIQKTEILAVAGVFASDLVEPGRQFDLILTHAAAVQHAKGRAILVTILIWLLIGGMLLPGAAYRPRDAFVFLVPGCNVALASRVLWRIVSMKRYWSKRPY